MTPAGAGTGRPQAGRVAAAPLALLLALAASLGACGGGEAGDDGSGQAGTGGDGATAGPVPTFPSGNVSTTLEVVLRDYAFVGIPATVGGPNVLFEAKVRGSNEHELVLDDGAGARVGGLSPFRAGTTRRLAAVLAPGTYTAVCLVKEGARTHADLGMRTTFTVT